MNEEGSYGLDKATNLINSGNYAEALEAARTVLVSDPTNVSAKLIEAIGLSQLGNARDASEAFAQAVEFGPDSVKAHFNAAVHEFNAGNVVLAQTLLDRALQLDPDHEGSKALLQRVGHPPKPDATPTVENPLSNYQRVSQQSMEVPYEGIELISKLGKGWNVIGFAIFLASFAVFMIIVASLFSHWTAISAAVDQSNLNQAQKLAMEATPTWIQGVDFGLRLMSVVWMIMDIVHRKTGFGWLIGHIPCTCCGFSFIVQPIYMLFGRK